MRAGTGRRRTVVFVLAALAMTLAACGDDDAATDSTAAATDPAAAEPTESSTDADAPADTTDDTGVEAPTSEVTTTAPRPDPLRIVSLSATHTEVLFAIDAADQLVAVDEQSNYPPEVSELPNDLSGFEPNVEAIAGYEPDLVIIGGDFTGLADQLAQVGIESWDGPPAVTLDDTYAQIEELGQVVGRPTEASELADRMRADVAEIVATTAVADPAPSYYHELDPGLFSVTSSSFIGNVYSQLGLRNVADELESDVGPFPQLSAEFLVSSNPDLIFLADTKIAGETAASVAARPGWEGITAVQTGNVHEMDDDVASRWGPRVVDYLAEVAAIVDTAES